MKSTEKEKRIVQADPANDTDQQRITLKPSGKETEITRELLSSGLATFSDSKSRTGIVGYDTPHLSKHTQTESFLIAQLPVNIQDELQEFIGQKFPELKGEGKGMVFFKGRMHADNIFFNRIETISNARQLPDILITSGINALYERPDIVNQQNYEVFSYTPHPAFAGSGLLKQGSTLRFLAADALVMVADRNHYTQSSLPGEWYELLHPKLEKSIVFCAQTDLYSQTLYAHFVRDFGINVLKQLEKNTLTTLHPIEMVQKLLGGNNSKAKLYVMPYSYARLLDNYIDYQIIWPRDGALLFPIQMLVKKGFYEHRKALISLLTGAEAGRIFARNGFIPMNRNVEYPLHAEKLNWPGWEFLKAENISNIKSEFKQEDDKFM